METNSLLKLLKLSKNRVTLAPKHLFIMSMLLASLSTSAQRIRTFSYDEMAAPVIAAQQLHNQREQYLTQLIDYALNVLSTPNIDNQLQNEINGTYNKLKTYYKEPLAYNEVFNQVRDMGLYMRECVVAYNQRVTNAQTTYSDRTSSYSNSENSSSNYSQKFSPEINDYYLYQTITDLPDAPLRRFPKAELSTIFKRFPINTKVYVLEIVNDSFYKVSINGYTGYMLKGFLK